MSEELLPRSYRIQCVHCRALFDAFDASWCECVVSEPTISCPSCHHCMCSSTPAQRERFWANAPKSLWDQRRRLTRSESAPQKSSDVGAPGNRPVVLVMDDSRVIRQMVMQSLAELDVQVVEAADGAQGLQLAMQLKPHVIVADALMPKLDGRVVCEAVKRNPATHHTKVAIVTGLYTAPRYKTEARRTFGADEYLVKPVQQEQLTTVVTRLLSQAAVELSIEMEIEEPSERVA